jgi:hypothetical protein
VIRAYLVKDGEGAVETTWNKTKEYHKKNKKLPKTPWESAPHKHHQQ